MRHVLITLALLSPGMALADVAEDATKLSVALEEAGCFFTAENGAAIAETAGLDQDALLLAVNELFAQSLVSVTEEGTMKLETEACK